MFRLYREMFQQLFLGLVYLRYVAGVTTHGMLADGLTVWMRNNPNLMPPRIQDWVAGTIRETRNIRVTPPDDTIDTMIAQMSAPATATADRDLIDAVVESLQLPFNAGRYQGGSDRTKALQKAILTPNELSALREKIVRAEMTCSACKAPFRDGELITFTTSGGGAPMVYCYRCIAPTWVACHTCREGVQAIDRKFYVGMSTLCDLHAKQEAGPFRRTRVTMPDPAIWQHIMATPDTTVTIANDLPRLDDEPLLFTEELDDADD